jgi:predicted MPP superfamily phosphohydrolase
MPKILNIILPIAILGFFAFSIWYTAYRLHVYFSSVPFWAIQTTVAFCAMGSVFASGFTISFSSSFASTLNIIGGFLLLFFAYLFILLILLHAIQIKWPFSLTWSGMIALIIPFIVIFAGAVTSSSFVVRETAVKISGLNKKLTIMQISDAHLGHHRGQNYLAKIVAETNQQNPDLIVITGDLLDSEPALLPGFLEPLNDFKAPVYFVEGNHERYLGIERVLKAIGAYDVRILHNEAIETQGIQLIGLDYMRADEMRFDMHPSDHPGTMKLALTEIPLKSGVPSVLLNHSPVGVQYVEAAGIDLMLSGHTHGLQVFPFSLLGKQSFPLYSGMYQHGNTKVFVSNGAGTYMARLRLGSRNEINLIRLLP